MSRIINLESAGKERARLTKSVALAVHELALQTELSAESRDLAAFISLALATIAETIDISVNAWEKRGYWVKADRFRMEWAWSGRYSEGMKKALLNQDWPGIANVATLIAPKLSKVVLPPGHRMGKPWVGAWNELQNQ